MKTDIYSISFYYLCFLLSSLHFCDSSSKFNSNDEFRNNIKDKKKFRERKLNDDSNSDGNNNLSFVPLSIYIDTIQFEESFPDE